MQFLETIDQAPIHRKLLPNVMSILETRRENAPILTDLVFPILWMIFKRYGWMIIPIAAGMVVNKVICEADKPFTTVKNNVSIMAQKIKSPVNEENHIYFIQKWRMDGIL